MALVVIDEATRAAVAAATDREANIAALVAPWAGGNVTVRVLAGSTLLATLTQGPWVAGPTSATLGTRQARTFVATGTPTRVVFRAGSTDIFELSAGVGSGDYSFPAGITSAALERLDGLVVNARSSLPDLLPTWVPAPGEVAVLRTSTGELSNTFVSQTSPLHEPFYSATIINDYGGGVLNPHWGQRGMVIFWGGGHAATNDNSAIGLELNETGGTFKRLTTPTDISETGTGPVAKLLNSRMTDASTPSIDTKIGSEEHAEYWDGQPVSPHTYGTLCVLGPADGGAAKGTLIKVVHGAGAVCGFFSAEAAHKIDFPTDTGAAGSYTWQRITNNRGRYVSHTVNDATFVAPVWEVLVPSQRRVYHEANYLGAPRWFDLDTEAYVIGTGAARAPCDSDVNGHVMLPIPERNLVVYLDRAGGIMRAQYLDTTQSNPSWTVAGALATPLTITADWCTACWCPDNQRIIVGDISGDAAACYEIEIPATLGNPWPVARAPFPSGQSIAWGPGRSYGKWSWNPRIKAIPYFPTADPDGLSDTVFVYRPRNT